MTALATVLVDGQQQPKTFWTILGPAPSHNGRRGYVRARCVCGTERELTRDTIQRGTSRSCGCALARFELRVHRTAACWLWTGRLSSGGYGQIGVRGVRVMAHRFAYTHFVGPIPEGLTLDHLCRVRNCVNPAHLEPVTAAENTRRGTVGHVNRAKTRCPQGHPYDEVNTILPTRGGRLCRTCRNTKRREKRAQLLARGELQHGALSGYDIGCRCAACRQAGHLAYLRRRARKAS